MILFLPAGLSGLPVFESTGPICRPVLCAGSETLEKLDPSFLFGYILNAIFNDLNAGENVQATDQNQKSIHTKVNQPFTVKLWEDRTTAHRWHLEFDPSAFSLIDDDFQRTTMASTVDAGNRVFEFKALKPGTYRLNFMKRMGVVASEVQRIFQIIVE